MMYIVSMDLAYEGSDILGAFTSLDAMLNWWATQHHGTWDDHVYVRLADNDGGMGNPKCGSHPGAIAFPTAS
jgi:hypothetical protein